MALNFSANQYDHAFEAKLLHNWEVPKKSRSRPRPLDGFTQIIASDRGHLLPGIKRSREFPWGSYIGTWDMPKKIAGHSASNPTARSTYAIERLEQEKQGGDAIMKGQHKKTKVPSPLPIRDGISSRGSDHRPPTGEERPRADNPTPPGTLAVERQTPIRTPSQQMRWPTPEGVPTPAPEAISPYHGNMRSGTPMKIPGRTSRGQSAELEWPLPANIQ